MSSCNPCFSAIRDDEVYVVNPYVRIRNEVDHVLVFGSQELGFWRFHRSYGVVLALCDGQRTVAEIAQLTRPLVRIEDDRQALISATENVKKFFTKPLKQRKR